MADKVRLALVGCGLISGRHVDGYRDLHARGCREFEVTACCSANGQTAKEQAAKIAAFQGSEPRVFTDITALIDSGVADAADVCVPHCFHHTIACSLLEGGLHVQLEKPVGITIRASRKIIAQAKRSRRLLTTAEHVRRTLPARACTWAVRDAKLLGELIAGEALVTRHEILEINKAPKRWRAVKLMTGGGPILDSGAHFADMMLMLFGEVDEVSCSMKVIEQSEVGDLPVIGKTRADVENYFHAVIRFVSGFEVGWTFSNRSHGEEIRIGRVFGMKGTITAIGPVMHPFEGGGIIVLADGRTLASEKIQLDYLMNLSGEEKQRLFPYGVTDGFSVQTWDFVNAIRTGEKPEMDGEAGLRAKTLSECCYESATLGRPVKYADVLAGRIDAYQRPIDEFWNLLDEKKASATRETLIVAR